MKLYLKSIHRNGGEGWRREVKKKRKKVEHLRDVKTRFAGMLM